MGGGVVVKQWTRTRPEDRQWTGQRANWRLSHKPVLWFHFSEWYFGWSRDTYILLLCHRTLVRLSRPSAIHLGAFQVFAPLLLRVISRSGCSTCPTAFFTAAHMLYPSSSFCPRFPSLSLHTSILCIAWASRLPWTLSDHTSPQGSLVLHPS